MASILGDGTGPGGPGPSRCLLLLQRSLAIQLIRGSPPHVANASQRESPKEHPADEMWMYDKGYNLFQVSHVIFVHIDFYLCHLFVIRRTKYRLSTILWSLGKQHRPPFPFADFCSSAPEKFNGSENVGVTLRGSAPTLRVLSFVPSRRAARRAGPLR